MAPAGPDPALSVCRIIHDSECSGSSSASADSSSALFLRVTRPGAVSSSCTLKECMNFRVYRLEWIMYYPCLESSVFFHPVAPSVRPLAWGSCERCFRLRGVHLLLFASSKTLAVPAPPKRTLALTRESLPFVQAVFSFNHSHSFV